MSSRRSGDAPRLRQEEEPQSRGQFITTGTWMEDVLPGVPPDGDLHYGIVEIVVDDDEYIHGQVSRSDIDEEDIDEEDIDEEDIDEDVEEDEDDEVYDLINLERSSSSLGSSLPRLVHHHNIIVCCNNDVFWERRRREQVTDEEDNYEDAPPSRRQRSEEEELNDLERRSFLGTQLHSTSSSTLDSELISDNEDFDDVEQDDDDYEELDRTDSASHSSSSRSMSPNFERMPFSNVSRYGLAFGWIRGHYMCSEE